MIEDCIKCHHPEVTSASYWQDRQAVTLSRVMVNRKDGQMNEVRNCTIADIRYAAHVYAYFSEIDENGRPILDSLDIEDVKAAAGMDDEFWQCTNCDTQDWEDFEDAIAHLKKEEQLKLWEA